MLHQRGLAAAAIAAAGQVRIEARWKSRSEGERRGASTLKRSQARLFLTFPLPFSHHPNDPQLRPLLQQSTRNAALNAPAATADASRASVASAMRSFFASSSSSSSTTTTTMLLRQRGGSGGTAKGTCKNSAPSRTMTKRSFNTYSDVPSDAAGQVRMT